MRWIRLVSGLLVAGCATLCTHRAAAQNTSNPGSGVLRAGASAVDITPRTFPVIVNGYTQERTADRAHDPLYVRCLVLDDGTQRLAVAVVDTCVLPRDLIDQAKQLARQLTGIPVDRMLISATHTHSAPSVMAALGSRQDAAYAGFLPGRIAEAVHRAAHHLAPAKAGWMVTEHLAGTHCRLWIMRTGRPDPFGEALDRVLMCPGYQDPDAIGPAGPVDPQLTLLAFQSPEGRPIALLANYGMHFYGAPPLSADYAGQFCRKIEELVNVRDEPPFVAIFSQGTSGDQHWMDYSQPAKPENYVVYGERLAEIAMAAYRRIAYRDDVPLAVAQTTLRLARRVPDARRLAWAKQVLEPLRGQAPRSRPEIYAREQLYLQQSPAAELVLQAVRVGDLGITAIPCEVYGITGLKLKAQSPLEPTMNIELANGEEGYIPPPEQHTLGGYSTWEARTAGLEIGAEPKIVEALLGLLEKVSGKPRRALTETHGPYAVAVLASKPVAYWRLGELAGPTAHDATANNNPAVYEDLIAFGLEGPPSAGFCGPGAINRCPHFAGGRIKAPLKGLGSTYSVELWLWSGLPADARPVTGYLFSRGRDGDPQAAGDHVGIGGTRGVPGRLFVFNGNQRDQTLAGNTALEPKTWYHVVFVRDGRRVAVYLGGRPAPEIAGELDCTSSYGPDTLFFGGRNDHFANFEGKLDEIAVYNRALTPDEAARHYQAASP